MKHMIILIFLVAFTHELSAQNQKSDSAVSRTWIGFEYGANGTHEDLADRYGFLNHVGLMTGFKTKKNYFFGLNSYFLFGNNVKLTGVFDHLTDEYGNITDINGDIAALVVFPRGFSSNLTIGKILPIFNVNNNSGVFIHGGVGFLLHKMKIETNEQVVPQLELDYKKGYDRLTTGINFHQFLGYNFMASTGGYHFYGGFYAQQGLTKNRRDLFYDRPDEEVSKDTRLDIQMGLKLGWVVPIYKRQPKEFYFD
tara:strand:- start:1021 stop:1779 length:759 start_codon:yes stop_codon:yes gene_type:complete